MTRDGKETGSNEGRGWFQQESGKVTADGQKQLHNDWEAEDGSLAFTRDRRPGKLRRRAGEHGEVDRQVRKSLCRVWISLLENTGQFQVGDLCNLAYTVL